MVKRNFKQEIFNLNQNEFNALALDIFKYQAKYNSVYAHYLQLIGVRAENILLTEQIPYLPIEFFKSQQVISEPLPENFQCFTSSSTTGTGESKHYVTDISLYHLSFIKAFELRFGPIKNFTFRFLLPSYLEREGSSLVYMANYFLNISGKGGFYLNDLEKLNTDLKSDIRLNKPVMLFGVSFALLDFAEQFPQDLAKVIVMETGGMKGRKSEITRIELHEVIKQNLKVSAVASEYGMTELLSQAYAVKDGIFECPPWMRVSVGQTTDPFALERIGKTGNLKIIDLANVNSCSFLSTSDLGRKHQNGTFEVLGRFDNSEARGCNLMYGG